MNLLQSDGSGGVIIDPAAYLLVPFKNIYDKDKSKDKKQALLELTYIFFMVDMRSDYIIIVDEQLRHIEVKKDLGLPKSWEPDKHVLEGIKFYKERSKSPIGELYYSSIVAVDIIKDELLNAKGLLAMQTEKGMQVYKITDILNALSKIPDVMKKLKEAEREYIKEINSGKDKSGSKQHNEFEDGFDTD